MTLPDFRNEVRSNGLALAGRDLSNVLAAVGCCTLGDVGDVVALSDIEEVASQLGTGELADFVADALGAGAPMVFACKAESVNGANGSVSETKTGDGTVVPSGVPLDIYDVVIEILTDGVLNVATFRYSLDGGETWSTTQTVPTDGVFAIPDTGITATFACSEGFDDGDEYSWSTTQTGMTTATLSAGLEVLRALGSGYRFGLVGVAGETGSTAWTAIDGKARLFAADHKYVRFITEAPAPNDGESVADWVAACLAEADGFASDFVGPVAARGSIVDQLTGEFVERNLAGIYAGWLCSLPKVNTSPAEVALGGVPNIDELAPEGITDAQIAQLDAAGFTTFRRITDVAGYYVTNGRLMSAETSDFRYIENGRTMDKACREARVAGIRLMMGDADDKGVKALLTVMKVPLRRMRGKGECVDFDLSLPAGQDVLGTGDITVKTRIQPTPKMRSITNDIGFHNPYAAE